MAFLLLKNDTNFCLDGDNGGADTPECLSMVVQLPEGAD